MFSAKNRQIFISKFSKHHYFAYSPNNHDRQYIKRSPIKAIKSKTQPNQNNRKQKPKFPTGWHYCATAKGRGSPPTTTKKPTTIDKIRTKTSKSEQKIPNQNKNFQIRTKTSKSEQKLSKQNKNFQIKTRFFKSDQLGKHAQKHFFAHFKFYGYLYAYFNSNQI